MSGTGTIDGLRGQRLLVIGASSGIGRSLVSLAGRSGARVLATARRGDRLDEMRRAESASTLLTMRADVCDPADCEAMAEHAATALGGLDALIYAAGMSTLSPLAETDATAWRSVLDINLVGAALCTRAALPHLRASGGRAVFLSSISATDPRPMLVPYGASKAALDAMIQGWRNEHPETAFIRVSVGPTATEFGAGWPADRVAALTEARQRMGLVRARTMAADDCARAILATLTAPVWIEDIRLTPDNGPGTA